MSDDMNVRILLSKRKRLASSAKGRQTRRRRDLKWQTVLHPRASNRKCLAANSGTVNRRPNLGDLEGRQRVWTGQGIYAHTTNTYHLTLAHTQQKQPRAKL